VQARSADSFRAVILGLGFVPVLLRLVSWLCLFALFFLSDSSFAALSENTALRRMIARKYAGAE